MAVKVSTLYRISSTWTKMGTKFTPTFSATSLILNKYYEQLQASNRSSILRATRSRYTEMYTIHTVIENRFVKEWRLGESGTTKFPLPLHHDGSNFIGRSTNAMIDRVRGKVKIRLTLDSDLSLSGSTEIKDSS